MHCVLSFAGAAVSFAGAAIWWGKATTQRKCKHAMAFVPVPEVMSVEVRATLDGQHVENRIMVSALGPVNELAMNSVGGTFVSWIQPTYQDLCNVNVQFTEVVVRDISVADGAEFSFPVGVAGLVDGAAYPNETSFCVSLRSGLTGRSRRGRIYLFPPSASYVIPPNRVTPGYVTGAVDAMVALLDLLDADGWAAGVVSYTSGGAPRTVPLFTRYRSAIAVDNLLDSMRSRKPGNGS